MTARRHAPALSLGARRAFALPAAIIALVLLSALVAGALFVSTEELRAGRTDLAGLRARAAAEWALDRAIAEWDAQRNTRMSVGTSETVDARADSRGDRFEVSATRVQKRSVWLTARATSRADGRAIPARHTASGALRLVTPALPLGAALTAGGAVTVDGGTVDGRGAAEPGGGDECEDGSLDAAGIVAPDSTRVCGVTCTGAPPDGVFGAPPVVVAAGLTSDSSSARTSVWSSAATWGSIMVAGGQLAPSPTVNAEVCLVSDPLNWGDPAGGPCRDHYPVIRVTGDLTLSVGSIGQGILLVAGSLRLEAGARFVGVVVATNDIIVAGTGAEILGVAFALDADAADGTRVTDGGAIRLARCVARRAMLGAGHLVRTPTRWWAELR